MKLSSKFNSIFFTFFHFFSISTWNYTTIKFLYQFSLEWKVFNLLIKWMKIELFFCFIQYVFNNNRNSMQPKKNKNSSFFLAQNILNTLEIKTEYSFVLNNVPFFMIKDYFWSKKYWKIQGLKNLDTKTLKWVGVEKNFQHWILKLNKD